MSLIKHYKNTDSQFGWVMIFIHWLLVLPVIGLFGLGLYMMDLGYYDSFYTLGPKIHEAIGIVVLLLMVFRLIWKTINPSPKPPITNSDFINTASKIAHYVIYLAVFTVLLSGLLISFAGGQGIEVFDWFRIPGPAELFENQATLAGDVHYYVAVGLMALVALHTLAALKHHFIDKDTTLSNMLGIEEKK